ncbi:MULTISPECIES: hypothetical protein [unclassified Desulfovibrio]|uniref:hypothetical protein n=1 Tax=unclassified Desulfovibrio TaxID=2593640 RepID=UPI0013EC3662|nr:MULTISPECIES: hypothetical protein [unclassified Desulfovibrio]
MRVVVSVLFFLLLLPATVFPSSGEEETIGYGISLTMPKGWRQVSNQLLTQAYNKTEALTGINQRNNKVLYGSVCRLEDGSEVASFRISIKKANPKETEEYTHNIIFADENFSKFRLSSVAIAKELNSKHNMGIDIISIHIEEVHIDNIIGILTSFDRRFGNTVESISSIILPVYDGFIKIRYSYIKQYKNLFAPIINNILSSIKIKNFYIEDKVNSKRHDYRPYLIN